MLFLESMIFVKLFIVEAFIGENTEIYLMFSYLYLNG